MTEENVVPQREAARMLRAVREACAWADPVPTHLVERLVTRLAARDLDAELAVLTLRAHEPVLASTRGTTDPLTVEFSGGEFSLLVRVTHLSEERQRLDGWVSPATPERVTLTADAQEFGTDIDESGRFEFADVPRGPFRLRVEGDHEPFRTDVIRP